MSNIFPKSANKLPLQIIIFLGILGGVAAAGITYYATPAYLRVGYQPVQPVPFDHSLHAGQLGMDCRYCHTGVDKGPASVVPTAQTCMNCHSIIKTTSPLLEVVRQSYATGEPVPWVKIHQAPDYVYFNHSIHIAKGVGCVSCHGRIDKMNLTYQVPSLFMEWCLQCHRNPAPNLRPRSEVFNMAWEPPADNPNLGAELMAAHNVHGREDCTACHR